MAKEFQGKTVLITGAASGIGYVLCSSPSLEGASTTKEDEVLW